MSDQQVRDVRARREGVIGVRRTTTLVGSGCVVALVVALTSGPSAVAAAAVGRPELPDTESQTVVAVQGDQRASRELQVLQASRSAMAQLSDAAAREQSQTEAVTGGASGASVPGATGAATSGSGPEQGSGSYAATPLSPSATWSSGGSAGSFTWSYPLRMVPSAGPVPQLAVTYDSGSVDGRLPATNNQPSWVGEGFDLPTSFVERAYAACDDDQDDGQSDVKDKNDLCWKSDNATLVLNGKANELVPDPQATTSDKDVIKRWRLKDDDASIVEQVKGADNGARDGEFWRVITPDGTRYTFGMHTLPGAGSGDPRTNSVFTVPVFGDDANEPCHEAGQALKARGCVQGWRWNLDYVVDTNDNAATYWYAKETNTYARLGDVDDPATYVRGGYLTQIKYGQRAGALFTGQAGQRVEFGVGERCVAGVSQCKELSKSTRRYWPDVPFDSVWDLNTAEDREGIVSPAFFTRMLLDTVSTSVWDAASKSYRSVDSWKFTHTFLNPGDTGDTSDESLWLTGIRQMNTIDGKTAMPAVEFTPIMLMNRVDGEDSADGIAELTKPRLRMTSSFGPTVLV
jgi:hypothetical protein